MIKKRSGESLLLILTCFPADGAPSLVLMLLFLSSNTYSYQTLCICLCMPGCIALGVSLWPAKLSQLWPAAVLHRKFGVCLVLQSLLHYETVILQLSPTTLHQYSPMLCYHQHIHLCGTVWDKQTKKWVQFQHQHDCYRPWCINQAWDYDLWWNALAVWKSRIGFSRLGLYQRKQVDDNTKLKTKAESSRKQNWFYSVCILCFPVLLLLLPWHCSLWMVWSCTSQSQGTLAHPEQITNVLL